jgi:hypothetical protein
VARLPAMARPALARIPIHFLAMIADQCNQLSGRGPGVSDGGQRRGEWDILSGNGTAR